MSVAEVLEGWAELELAAPDYLEAEAYALGEVDEVFASNGEIARKLARASRHYRFPLIRVPITARVNRCKITTIKVAENEALTDRIAEVWDGNDLAVWYPELFFKTFMYGDAYTMVWPLALEDEEDFEDESAADDELLSAGVEFTIHDPLHVRVIYDRRNVRRKAFAVNRWQIPAPGEPAESKAMVWRVDLYFPDSIEHWVSLKDAQLDQPSAWEPFTEDTLVAGVIPAVEENPFGEVPFFHHRTALPYGVPVHKNGYGAQNAITKMLVTQLDTSDSQGWPSRYRLLDPDAELDTNQDTPEFLDDNDAVIEAPAGIRRDGATSSMRSGPGVVETFPGTKEVGQFEAADPALLLGPAEVYLKIMATLTETPHTLFYPEETPVGAAPSGVALSKANEPLNASVERLQTLQRGALQEEWTFAFKVEGTKVRPRDIAIVWEPLQRASTTEDWTVVEMKQGAGVPVEVTLEEAGYTEEEAAEWQAEKERKEQEMKDQLMELTQAKAGNENGAKPAGPKPPAAPVVPK